MRTGQKSLVLILFRELAARIASPVFIVGPDGTLLFYNERAEELLGMRFEDAGELAAADWGTRWSPRGADGAPIPLEELPLMVALSQHRPSHGAMRITDADGRERDIEVSAIPLNTKEDEFVGAAAVFWEKA